MAESPVGVRVISVTEDSPAFLSDLRPEDIVVEVNGRAVKTIDEFAVLSHELKGRSTKVTVLVLRNGEPQTLLVHLYSVLVLRQWGLSFVPEHDIRFADSSAGVAYWMRLARGFQEAKDPERALNAILNALHNDPSNLELALKASDLLWAIARKRLNARRIPQALVAIQHGTTLLQRLFEHPLADVQLEAVKRQLADTLQALRQRRQDSIAGELEQRLQTLRPGDPARP